MNIIKYTKDYKNIWNEFLKSCKNNHFFFQRDYMEYHNSRFDDYSLLFYGENNKLLTIFPANAKGNILYSHQGLTFGGFLIADKVRTETMLDIFESLKSYLKNKDFKKLVYKCIPYIYYTKPSEEDRYALFINNARLLRRDVSSTVYLKDFKYTRGRKSSIKKARNEDISTIESTDYEGFWEVLTQILESNYDVKPVHSLKEIKELASLFPENIKLFLAKKNEKIISGVLIFENRNIIHTQYLANSTEGKQIGGLDILIDYLIQNIYKNKIYFDFGISNEKEGRFLNKGLIFQKEGFGGRAVVHDFYELDLV